MRPKRAHLVLAVALLDACRDDGGRFFGSVERGGRDPHTHYTNDFGELGQHPPVKWMWIDSAWRKAPRNRPAYPVEELPPPGEY